MSSALWLAGTRRAWCEDGSHGLMSGEAEEPRRRQVALALAQAREAESLQSVLLLSGQAVPAPPHWPQSGTRLCCALPAGAGAGAR